mmetsp:Transcript_116180/g.202053  ORF Transcript_116180/g.202053 Transcript_116180/m.202053 type:complete len:85 (+) Transcript_116180:549-803(+)
MDAMLSGCWKLFVSATLHDRVCIFHLAVRLREGREGNREPRVWHECDLVRELRGVIAAEREQIRQLICQAAAERSPESYVDWQG